MKQLKRLHPAGKGLVMKNEDDSDRRGRDDGGLQVADARSAEDEEEEEEKEKEEEEEEEEAEEEEEETFPRKRLAVMKTKQKAETRRETTKTTPSCR